jgi:hypothetical protein
LQIDAVHGLRSMQVYGAGGWFLIVGSHGIVVLAVVSITSTL